MSRKSIYFTIIRWTLPLLLVPALIKTQYLLAGPILERTLLMFALITIIAMSYCMLIIREPRYRPRVSALTISLTAFLVLAGVTTITSADPALSFWGNPARMGGFITLFYFWLLFIVVGSVFREWKDWILFLRSSAMWRFWSWLLILSFTHILM
jgi:hypothetical protein